MMDRERQLNRALVLLILVALALTALINLAGCAASKTTRTDGPGDLTEQTAAIATAVDDIKASVASVETRLSHEATSGSTTTQNAPHGRNTAVTTSIAVTGGGAVATIVAVGVLAWRFYRVRRMLIAATSGVERYSPARSSQLKEEFIGPAADELGVRPALRAFAARHARRGH